MLPVSFKAIAKNQAGITLIEVLISVLLTAIIGLGAAYIAARTTVIQRNGNIQVQAINKMRQVAIKADSSTCTATSTITINGTTVTTPCTINATTYTVAAFNSTTGPGSSVASADVTVEFPSIQVDSAASFVPVKSVISP